MSAIRSIVVTGGPGAGKSTLVAELTRRVPSVRAVPEVATALFTHLLPVPTDGAERRIAQRAIYQVQVAMEDLYRAQADARTTLVFDRGLLDGAAYWPGGTEGFFNALGGSLEAAFLRYDAVVYLESAALGGHAVSANNSARRESVFETLALDERLRNLWQSHPEFHCVSHAVSLEEKTRAGLRTVEALLSQ